MNGVICSVFPVIPNSLAALTTRQPAGRARIVATTGKTIPNHHRPDPTLPEVQAMADTRAGGGFQVTDPAWLSNFNINERKVAQYNVNRVFLAGDAAHIHSPAGGQGMNTGMQDAMNLAWKRAMVLHQQAAPTLLNSYSPERSAVGDMVLRNVTRMTDMATLANPLAQSARNLAMRFALGLHTVRDRMAATMSEIEIAYAKSPLSTGPHAGRRLPPETYAGPPPGAGPKPLFTLYAQPTPESAALAARYPTLLDPTPRPPTDPETLLLVRPDAYTALSAPSTDLQAVDKYLQVLQPA